jgi:hypothetical protein
MGDCWLLTDSAPWSYTTMKRIFYVVVHSDFLCVFGNIYKVRSELHVFTFGIDLQCHISEYISSTDVSKNLICVVCFALVCVRQKSI